MDGNAINQSVSPLRPQYETMNAGFIAPPVISCIPAQYSLLDAPDKGGGLMPPKTQLIPHVTLCRPNEYIKVTAETAPHKKGQFAHVV